MSKIKSSRLDKSLWRCTLLSAANNFGTAGIVGVKRHIRPSPSRPNARWFSTSGNRVVCRVPTHVPYTTRERLFVLLPRALLYAYCEAWYCRWSFLSMYKSNSTYSICCGLVVQHFDLLWICCGFSMSQSELRPPKCFITFYGCCWHFKRF